MAPAQRLITITGIILAAGLAATMVISSCTEVKAGADGRSRPRDAGAATPVAVTNGDVEAVVPSKKVEDDTPRETVTIGGRKFRLELAADDPTRTRGLMRRTSIADDGGMLFVFPDSQRRAFWMKNCLIDMDIMFLDARGRITALHRMKAQPPRGASESEFAYERRMRLNDYESRYPAQFAIELKAGSIEQLNLHVEDKIALDLPRLKALAR